MERKVGTVSRGIRCPIIREGDDLAKIVVSSIVGALLRKRLTQAGVLKLQNAVSE